MVGGVTSCWYTFVILSFLLEGKTVIRLVAVFVVTITKFNVFPDRFVQDFKNHIGGYLVFWRILLWLVQHTHAVIPEHLKTSEEGRVTIKAASGTKARDSDNWHLQSGIFTQDAGGQCIRDAPRPLVDRVEGRWEDHDRTSSGEDIRFFRAFIFAAHGIACNLFNQRNIKQLCALWSRDDTDVPSNCLCLHHKIWDECG